MKFGWKLGKYKLKGKHNNKVSQRQLGPFKIIRKVSPLAYELDLPQQQGAGARLHPVISIQHLRPGHLHDDPFERTAKPPGPVEYGSDSDNGNEQSWELERVVDERVRRLKKGSRKEYLVRWKGFGAEHDSWMKENELNNAQELLGDWLLRQETTKALKGKETATQPNLPTRCRSAQLSQHT